MYTNKIVQDLTDIQNDFQILGDRRTRKMMANVREVADNIYWLDTAIKDVKNTFATYFIPGPEGILIEPGPTVSLQSIRDVMNQLAMKDLAYIIISHVHVDHAGGTGSLSELFPQAKVLVHPRGKKHVIDPTKLVEGTKAVWGVDFANKFGSVLPVMESRIITPEDGEVILVNGRELQIIHTPGHAPHHMATFDKKTRSLFCGEALGLVRRDSDPFPLPAVAPPNFEQDLYLETIEKLRRLNPSRLLFSHGGLVEEPDKIISIALESTKAFGEMVLKAMQDGETPEEISNKVVDFALARFGRALDETDLMMAVGGYAIYFKSRGLA